MIKKDKRYSIGDILQGYTIQQILGEGRYGIAYLGKDISSDKKVVIKQLKKSMIEKTKDKLKFEVEILSKLDDHRFPKFICEFEDKENLNGTKNYSKGYILEYKEGKTFEQIIYKDKYVFSREEIYDIAFKIIDMIKVLYENNVVHKDIRVSNVILNGDCIYLIDFGLARNINKVKYKKDEDYWYLADFLIHLYYTSYTKKGFKNKPWYEELDLIKEELLFLKKLMGIEGTYDCIYKIEKDLYNIKQKVLKF